MSDADEIRTNEQEQGSAGSTATEESGWLDKLRYNRSFTAKLLLSDPTVKEYYAAVATELLSYERVHSYTGWSGVTFSAGRVTFARCAVSGKTLCLYLAVDPATSSGTRYRAKDVSETRRYEKTPALFSIRSQGALKHALDRIREAAALLSLTKKDPLPEPIQARLFPADSFRNLITRGLIRPLRAKSAERTENPAAPVLPEPSLEEELISPDTGIYLDTVHAARGLMERYPAYGKIRESLMTGEASIRISEKKMLRALDECWVRKIEDSLPALDELIRRPSHFIAEHEEILPMELTRKITGRSVVHLCQHTGMIASVKGEEVTPAQMLNIFREDSVLTYENKFLNTLLAHLYHFVSERYRIALQNGVDERLDLLDFEDSFYLGETKGRLSIRLELSEKLTDSDGEKKGFLATGLWERVERLNGIVREYMESDFVREMGRNYVKPPILRTNAILKNKYFRECLELWNFLEGYDESGYGITVSETLKDPGDDYLQELYENAAEQYLLFCHHARKEYREEEALATYESPLIHPRLHLLVGEEEEAVSPSDFEESVEAPSLAGERDVLLAMRVALRAAEFYDVQALSDGTETDELIHFGVRYEKNFEARIRLAEEDTKAYFIALANGMLRYRKVKMRTSRSGCVFCKGRTPLLRMTIRGKTLCVYVALSPDEIPASYYARNVSDIKRYASTPVLLRVRSDRWLRYAFDLEDRLAMRFGLVPSETADRLLCTEDYAVMSFEELLSRGWVRRVSAIRRPAMPDTEDEEEPRTAPETTAAETAVPSAEEAVSSGKLPELPEETEPAVADGEASPEEMAAQVDGLKSFEFGQTKQDVSEHPADYFENSEANPLDYPVSDQPVGEAEEDRLLPELRYPGEMDYSRPAQKGVDDSSGFIHDIEATEESASGGAEKKSGIWEKLLGKIKDKKK